MSFFEDASLVLIPSAQKLSKIYSVKPTDGTGDLAFTRSNDTATRVASNGLIQKVRTNLALYSEQFDNAVYTKSQASVTANATTAPNGTTTADKLVEDTSNDIHRILQDSLPYTSGVEITLSVYAKPAGRSKIELRMFDFTSNFASVYFDISAGTIFSTIAGVGTITDAGNGWYRCSVTAPASATSANGLALVYLLNAGGADSYTGDGTSGAFLWGLQVERGVATPYIATTTAAVSVGPVANVPRLDYLGSTCPKLILEPQRVNLVTFSEQINNAAWAKGNSPTITTNIATAPDGTISADGIQSADAANYKTITQTVSVSANGTLTLSFFVKKETSETAFGGFTMYFQGGTPKVVYGIVNAVNGTVTYASSDLTPTTKVESYGNYWRIASTATDNGSNTSCGLGYYGTLSTNGTALNPGAGSVRTIWGFQAEVGAYATSYIPTLGASVTRGADGCLKTGISSLIGQTEGTIYFEVDRTARVDNDYRVQISDGTTNNWLFLGVEVGNNIRAYVNVGGVNQFSAYGAVVTNGIHKVAMAYKANDFKVYIDGVAWITQTSGSVPACSRLDIGSSAPTTDAATDSKTSQALLFKTRLTNAQLAELTA